MNNIQLNIIGSQSFIALLRELELGYTIISDDNLKYSHKNLLIRIIFGEKLQLIQIKKYFNENIPTIFLLNSRDFMLRNKLSLLEFHVSLFTPIEILSFREILNILVTKYNFFKKSKIVINGYEIDSNQRIIKKNDIKTFSAVYEKNQYGDESKFIKLYENELETMFYIYPDDNSLLNDLENFVIIHAEPIPGTGPYAQFKVMELAKGKVVVTLDGQGADEMLAGYHYFFGYYFKDLLKHYRIKRLISEIYFYLKIHRSLYGLKAFVYLMLPTKLKTKLRVRELKYLNKCFEKKYRSSSTIAGNLYESSSLNDALIDHFEFKLEHLLKWEDRNSMAFGIEARVPFLDHRLVEATLRLDGRAIIKKGMTKSPLREAMKGLLPESIRLRTDKIGFGTPQDEWFRSVEFQRLVNDILFSKSFLNRNIIEPDVARRLYQKHLDREINIAQEIWKWINLEIWFRRFID